mmetsp:Transcript_15606/g.44422  ORF Transcript_15606/g.44422 Transcript_15606/m.44422 type:complete len:272 (+) Transcript_15606:460-1275(+)
MAALHQVHGLVLHEHREDPQSGEQHGVRPHRLAGGSLLLLLLRTVMQELFEELQLQGAIRPVLGCVAERAQAVRMQLLPARLVTVTDFTTDEGHPEQEIQDAGVHFFCEQCGLSPADVLGLSLLIPPVHGHRHVNGKNPTIDRRLVRKSVLIEAGEYHWDERQPRAVERLAIPHDHLHNKHHDGAHHALLTEQPFERRREDETLLASIGGIDSSMKIAISTLVSLLAQNRDDIVDRLLDCLAGGRVVRVHPQHVEKRFQHQVDIVLIILVA